MLVAKPRLLFRPDPVIGWSLAPGHGVRVRFRPGVVQRIGPDGWRRVPRPDGHRGGPRIAIYGCSFTYGTGLSDEETFVARLQRARPDVTLLNRGIGGHGTVQNLLQLRRDVAAHAVDGAVLAVMSDHRYRNVAHPQRMRQYMHADWHRLGVEHVPLARLDASGRARLHYLPIRQPLALDGRLAPFLPDEHALTATTLAVLDRAIELASDVGVPLRIALLDRLDPDFSRAMREHHPAVLDIAVPLDAAHSFAPVDPHPNAHANVLYAERLRPALDAIAFEARTKARDGAAD